MRALTPQVEDDVVLLAGVTVVFDRIVLNDGGRLLQAASLLTISIPISWLFEIKSQCDKHVSTNLSKHVSVTFGQTEKWAFLVFGLFHLSLLRKVHQSP